jgi:hypothetical protein
MALIRSVKVGDRTIDLHKFSGEVVEEKKWATTQVSGGGGGYNVGSGQNNPVSVSSVTQTHDQFFLKDDKGQEMAVEMTDAGLALRKGNRVSVFWGIIQGDQRGPYVAIVNHTTNSVTKIESAIQGLAVKPTSGFVTLAWIACVFGLCFYGLGLIGMVALFIAGRKRKKRNQELADTFKAALDGAIAESKGV